MIRSRLYILLKLFLVLMFIFIIQKPLFMLYNCGEDGSVGLVDYFSVMWHGLPLDATMTGYVLVIPWLMLTVSFFVTMNMRRWMMPYFAVIAVLLAVIFVADTVMYGFWHFKLDSTVFLYTDKPADAMASVSVWFVILTFLSGIVIAAVYAAAFFFVLPKGEVEKGSRHLSSLVMLPVAALLFVMIRGGVGEGTANVSNAYYSSNQYLNHSAVNGAFSMFYSMAHKQDFASEYQFFDDTAKVNSLLKGMYDTRSVDTERLLNTDRPNIVLVVWEGCGASLAGCVGAEGNVTPHLDALAREGVLFTNCYANSFRTDRGLVCINSGWLGLPSASLMKIPEKCEKLPGLARTLHANGYTTSFWYGGDISFTNMGGFMLQNGYQTTVSDKDFPKSDRMTAWGVPDGPLFDKVLESIRKAKHPSLTTIMTLSSHEPWEVPYHRLSKDVENSFAYTDDCLGRFVKGLKASGCWDNTLLIIVPDHGAIGQEGKTFSTLDVIHIPLIMTGGAIREKRNIHTLMNQSDIAATLLGQLGLNHDEFIFSRDVMSKTYTYPTAIHCSKIEFTFRDSTGVSTYDLEGGRTVNNMDSVGHNEVVRVKKGKAILQRLYKTVAGI